MGFFNIFVFEWGVKRKNWVEKSKTMVSFLFLFDIEMLEIFKIVRNLFG